MIGRADRHVTEYYGRSAWTSSPRPADRLVPLDPGQVRGVAIHHTGSATPLGRTTLQRSARRLEDERIVATGVRGWSDVPCQAAIDVDGRVFDCRGIDHRPQANGNPTANAHYGAVTLLLGAGDDPTPAMVEAFRDWRLTHWLTRYPRATAVVGHRDLYPTDCPGPAVHDLIRSGALGGDQSVPATPTSGGSVPLTDAEIDAIAVRTRDRILAVTYGSQPDGRPFTLAMLWGEVRVNSLRAATGVDIEALATAILHRLAAGEAGLPAQAAPPGLDAHALAVAVADELAARLRA